MRSPLLDRKKWVLMASIDVILMSITQPMSFYIGMIFSIQGFSPRVWLCLLFLIFANTVSLLLGYVISWLIYSKK